MSKKKHILSLLVALLIFAHPAFSQDEKVCIGTKVMYKAVGEDGSTYEYEVPLRGGELAQKYADSIIVKWGNTKGIYALGLRETSTHGCEGNWAYLNVEVVGEYATFGQNSYTICKGDGVTVDFNASAFKAYEWVDKSIQDNVITKPGTYELRTIDMNNCRLSSYVKILPGSPVAVNLGPDTMICTPGFRLDALYPNTNPQGTTFTWSTGESGTSPFIQVNEHDTQSDMLYWVRADHEGCSASDTIVIMACKELPVNLDIPNTFTPNGDGDNDVWEIKVLRDYQNSIVEVYDRWGRKVFTSTKGYVSNPWNGRDARGHVLPMETYYYIIHLNDGRSNKPILGTITIIR